MSCRVYEGEPVLLARGRQGSRVEFGRGEGEESVGTVSRKGGKVAVRCVMCVMGTTGRGGQSYLGSLRLGRED